MANTAATAAADTRQPAPAREDDRFGLRVSLAAHGAILCFILFKGIFFPGKAIPYIPALRVDMVGLPDVLKKDLGKLAKLPAPPEIEKALKEAEEKAKPVEKHKDKAPPKADDEVGLKQRKDAAAREKKNKNALDRMKALAKITEEEKPTKASAIVKGNMVSKGTSLSAEAKESMQAGYLDLLRDRLQENWSLPVWLARQKLDAQILLYIDGKGRMKGLKFVKSSGNPRFDDEVRNAVSQSQPFPAPPEGIESSLLANGVLIGFPL